jgi:hypothetical protein
MMRRSGVAAPARSLALAAVTIVVAAADAGAQVTAPLPGPPVAERGFLSRYGFQLGAARVGGADASFRWDADFRGEVDIITEPRWRATFLAGYEAILGDERRAFDPVQGNYILDLSASGRVGGGELAGIFHHVSRHLSDRAKRDPIDWNMVGARYTRELYVPRAPKLTSRVAARALWAIQRSLVDYGAEMGIEGDAVYRVDARLAALGAAGLDLLTTRGSDRGAQVGVRLEGGVRVGGGAGALDLIVRYERRIELDPFLPAARNLLIAGFRLVH